MRKLFAVITIIGGGSNYTSEVIRLLIEQAKQLGLKKIRLMDTDQMKFLDSGKTRMEINAGLARRMVKHLGLDIEITVHYELVPAITGTNLVLTQIRPGMNQERIRLELLGHQFGSIGQETNGIGGMALACLSIPAVLEIAWAMEKYAPGAPMINFTNPAGMVTQAVLNHSSITAFGMCNIPICFLLESLHGIGLDDSALGRLDVGWTGLNHLTFMNRFEIDGRDRIDDVIAYFATHLAEDEWGDLGVVAETVRWMEEHQIVPGHYVPYYLFPEQVREFQIAEARKNGTRGQNIAPGEVALFRELLNLGLVTTPDGLKSRGGTNYSKAAIRAIIGLMSDDGMRQVLCCKNESLSFLGGHVAVEVPTVVTTKGAKAIEQVAPPQVEPLIAKIAGLQTMVVEAAMKKESALLLQAALENPTCPDDEATCRAMVDALFAEDEQGLFVGWS